MSLLQSFGLLILRLGAGFLMVIQHGLPKLLNFSENAERFPDLFGWGSYVSFILALFAEFFCSIAIIWGLFTRLAAIPLVVTMGTAAFIIHGADPFEKKELALLYAVPFLTLIFTGPGRFSIDHLLFYRKKSPPPLEGAGQVLQKPR